MITLNKEECENLIDALEEWNDVVGPKDCEPIEDETKTSVGLNYDRYTELINKLKNEQTMKDIHTCEECGSQDVKVCDYAWFDPNNDLEFIEACEMSSTMSWCNNCNDETSLITKENNK